MTKEKKEKLKKMLPNGMVKDIATELGISRSFVSRVVNGHDSSENVWRKVQEKIDELYEQYYSSAA